jgi:hypothetical protein
MRRIACILAFVAALPAADAFAQQGVPLLPAAPQTTPPPTRPTLPPPGSVPVPPVEPQTTTPPSGRPLPTRPPQTAPPAGPGAPVMPIAPGQIAPPRGQNVTINRDGGSSWQNVRIDVFITDTLTVDKPTNKVVSMLVLDGRSGQVRSNSQNGTINVDAAPAIRPDGRVYLQLTLEYLPEIGPLPGQQGQMGQQQMNNSFRSVAAFNESLMLVVVDGRRTVVSESSDPKSERKVTLEITATVVK